MFNVTGKGLICKDVEFVYTRGGTAICEAVAVNQDNYDEDNPVGHFTNLKLFGEVAERFANEVTKGCIIEITNGILKHPRFEGKNGTVYRTEVIVFDFEVDRDLNAEKEQKPKNNKKANPPKSKNNNKKK